MCSDLIADELNATDSFTNYRVQMFRITGSTSPLFDKASFEREPSRSRKVTPLLAVITLMHDARKKRERKRETGEVLAARTGVWERETERERREKLSHPTGFRSWLPSCANRASHFWTGRSGERNGPPRRAALRWRREMRHLRDLPRRCTRLNYHAEI